MSAIDDADLDAILQRAFPQGYSLLRHEDGTELLRHSARSLIGSPALAREILGPKTTAALGHAVLTLGERYVQIGRALLALAAADPNRPAKACSGPRNLEVET